MAKSNPIGIRFDLDKLELIKKEQNLESPQKVLNWLMNNYENTKTWLNRMTQTEKAVNNTAATVTTKSTNKWTIKEKEKPPTGLAGLALTIWKHNHK